MQITQKVICFLLRWAPTDKVHQLPPICLPMCQVQFYTLLFGIIVSGAAQNHSCPSLKRLCPHVLQLTGHSLWACLCICTTNATFTHHILWLWNNLNWKGEMCCRGLMPLVGCKFNGDSLFLIKRGPPG